MMYEAEQSRGVSPRFFDHDCIRVLLIGQILEMDPLKSKDLDKVGP